MTIQKIKEAIKNLPLLYPAYLNTRAKMLQLSSIADFMKERKIQHNTSPIKVGFICQYIPGWNKIEPVYKAMLDDPRFEPFLICIPDVFNQNKMTDPTDISNPVYDYFFENAYTNVYNGLIGPNQFLDLQAMDFSYIFYIRPYNSMLPKCYTASAVAKYSRVCVVMYGTTMTDGILDITLNSDFMRSVYCYFAETDFMKRENIARNWWPHKHNFCKTVCLGMPFIESIRSEKNTKSPAWDFSKNNFRVIWTPRWTTELEKGGTNFFCYYQKLLEYARSHPDIDFLFRPHPLAFKFFLESGKMTQEELDAFKSDCAALSNVSIDCQKEYVSTFWGADVLISDISGIIPEYFCTGKPLIYCDSNMILTPLEHTKKIFSGSYMVRNSAELFACLDQLKSGQDPKAEIRKKLIDEIFGDQNLSPAKKILDFLSEDSQSGK